MCGDKAKHVPFHCLPYVLRQGLSWTWSLQSPLDRLDRAQGPTQAPPTVLLTQMCAYRVYLFNGVLTRVLRLCTRHFSKWAPPRPLGLHFPASGHVIKNKTNNLENTAL